MLSAVRYLNTRCCIKQLHSPFPIHRNTTNHSASIQILSVSISSYISPSSFSPYSPSSILSSSPQSLLRPHTITTTRPFFRSLTTSQNQQQQQGKQQNSNQEQQEQDDDQKQQQNRKQEENPYDDSYASDAAAAFQQQVHQLWRRIGYVVLGLISFGSGIYFSSRGHSLHSHDRPDSQRSFSEMFTDIWEGFVDFIEYHVGSSHKNLLPSPTLDAYNRKPRTIVLALEDTLTHMDWDRYQGYTLRQRPDLHYFIEQCFKLGYELVIFSTKTQYEVEPIIQSIDKTGMIRYRLYYEQTNMSKGYHLIKDLTRLNRELKRMIVIDWNRQLYDIHQDNVLLIDRWKSDESDPQLKQLLKFLEKLQKYNIYDVRPFIIQYNQHRDNESEREKIFEFEESLIYQAAKEKEQRKKLGNSSSSSSISGNQVRISEKASKAKSWWESFMGYWKIGEKLQQKRATALTPTLTPTLTNTTTTSLQDDIE